MACISIIDTLTGGVVQFKFDQVYYQPELPFLMYLICMMLNRTSKWRDSEVI